MLTNNCRFTKEWNENIGFSPIHHDFPDRASFITGTELIVDGGLTAL